MGLRQIQMQLMKKFRAKRANRSNRVNRANEPPLTAKGKATSHPRSAVPHTEEVKNDLVNHFKDLTLAPENSEKEEPTVKELTCHLCGKNDIKSKSGLTRHLKTLHKDHKIVPKNMLQCDLCEKTCKNQSGLTRHQKFAQK